MNYIIFYNKNGNQKMAIFYNEKMPKTNVDVIMAKVRNIAIGNDYTFNVLDSESVNKRIPLIDGNFFIK